MRRARWVRRLVPGAIAAALGATVLASSVQGFRENGLTAATCAYGACPANVAPSTYAAIVILVIMALISAVLLVYVARPGGGGRPPRGPGDAQAMEPRAQERPAPAVAPPSPAAPEPSQGPPTPAGEEPTGTSGEPADIDQLMDELDRASRERQHGGE